MDSPDKYRRSVDHWAGKGGEIVLERDVGLASGGVKGVLEWGLFRGVWYRGGCLGGSGMLN